MINAVVGHYFHSSVQSLENWLIAVGLHSEETASRQLSSFTDERTCPDSHPHTRNSNTRDSWKLRVSVLVMIAGQGI